MRLIRQILLMVVFTGNADATVGVEVDFMEGEPIILPGDCVYSINDSAYICSLEQGVEAYVDFPFAGEALASFEEIKSQKMREDGKQFELRHTSIKKVNQAHHFAVQMLVEDVFMHGYTVCDFSDHCISAVSSSSEFIEKLMHQISPTLIHYSETAK